MARRSNEAPNQKSPEKFQEVTLSILPPHMDKHAMIYFNTSDITLARCYNAALGAVLKEAGPTPFHQMGRHGEPGEHGWEMLGKEVDTETLEALFPKVHKKAEEFYSWSKKS